MCSEVVIRCKMKYIRIAFMFLFCLNVVYCDIASVTWSKGTASYQIHHGNVPNAVAWANFTNEVNKTGWSYLEVYTSDDYPNSVQAYAAGLVEGHITKDFMAMHWRNTNAGFCALPLTAYCKSLHKFLETNFKWQSEMISQLSETVPYWHQVRLYMEQIMGLQDGYANKPSKPRYTVDDIFNPALVSQYDGDLEDLEEALKKDGPRRRVLGSGSCSALIKVLPNNKDLYVSQDSWTSFQSMLRILKKYDFSFHLLPKQKSPVIPGKSMTFSSYPGALSSGDDYYLISSGLATLETTIGNSNPALWSFVKPTRAVLESIRSMVANRISTSAPQWAETFAMYNSGTYNNQWMVVDYKLFVPGQPLRDNLLVVLEQIPGMIVSRDMASVLRKQTYWPSYNSPYFPEIFNMSGLPAMVKKYGNWFSYDHTPRANIFRRDHKNVQDLQSMIKLMRYNDFKHDPLSRCNCTPPYSAENAISARSDLNPANGKYPFGALGHRAHGGVDMKVTTSSMFKSLEFVSQAGPTFDNVPPFQWSKSDFKDKLSHEGHPDLFQFVPVQHKWGPH